VADDGGDDVGDACVDGEGEEGEGEGGGGGGGIDGTFPRPASGGTIGAGPLVCADEARGEARTSTAVKRALFTETSRAGSDAGPTR
jgi:hypothetical protein